VGVKSRQIEPIAVFRSPFTSKFGVPRQSGLVETLRGRIVFTPAFRHEEAIRGLEDFDYIWLIWGFENERSKESGVRSQEALTVRPPRLGGNERVGVFASRSPFRPNGLGLSSVRIAKIENGEIEVLGADLMDGTPIYDIKPYVPYADSHPTARGGFTEKREWKKLEVEIPEEIQSLFSPDDLQALIQTLEQDPRPHYHHDPHRVYGMPFAGHDVKFRVENNKCIVLVLD
jgi:tRNA-Thr(GGU) m(6)t(6)A37 methyltransferase TsaA